MKQVILQENEVKQNLYPFSSIRHTADIRIGILTIREKWERLANQKIALVSESKFIANDAVTIPANVIPSKKFVSNIINADARTINHAETDTCKIIEYPWHIFQWNDWALRQDYEMLTENRTTAPIPETVHTTNPQNIFIEEGAVLGHCILNATTGPIYIGRNTEIMEGTSIRGPFALCEGSVVKMGARIYGATTVGPFSVVGGEIKNAVIFGYSNKAHEGYLGDSVIGEWCNLGAGTTNSNLKNNVGEIKVWNPVSRNRVNAGIKCGLFMGDYSRSAINTAFNTGTLVGICSNVFGEGLSPTFIPDFSWGSNPVKKYEFEKAVFDIANWKKLKGKSFTDEEIKHLRNIFNQS